MRRLVSIDTDAKFFPLCQAALKSFLKYNPDWAVEIIDIGVTDEQRAELSGIGRVVTLDRDENSRWPSIFPRLTYFRDNPDRADLLFHLDADTLTFGSIELLVDQFLHSSADFAIRLFDVHAIHEYIRSHRLARQIFPRFDSWKNRPGGNAGVTLATAATFARIADRVLKIAGRYAGLFPNRDQEITVSVLYEDGYKLLEMPKSYNHSLGSPFTHPVVLVEPPLAVDGRAIVIAHLPVLKWAIFSGDGNSRFVGRWWSRIAERYEEEPWPPRASL